MRGKVADKERLGHILYAIKEIEAYTANIDLKDFLANSMMRFASIKQIEIIGEAANYLSPETKAIFTDVEWKQIVGMRHILIHEYFGVDKFHLIKYPIRSRTRKWEMLCRWSAEIA